MGWRRPVLSVTACFAAFVLVVGTDSGVDDGSNRAPPEATIKSGSLSGKWMSTRDGRDIAAFEGIPYAAPPVGELRFKRAQTVEPWTGVRKAVKPGSICTQRNIYFHSQEIEGSEDCLYINVYTPEGASNTESPVLFWIHGGGWLSGTGDIYGPEYLLDKDVVLVTFNYRLGPLGTVTYTDLRSVSDTPSGGEPTVGFLSTGDDAIPGNNGLKDIVFALHWVQDNIRAFGGDSDSVTVFGESAGGASVHLLTLSPLAKGLFHRALAMSGNAFAPWAFHHPGEARRQARVLAKHTACPEAPSEAFLACLRDKKAEDIVSVDQRFMQWDIHPHMPFKATVERGGSDASDAPFMDMHPREAYSAGYLHEDVPFMTGFTTHDGGVMMAVVLANDTNIQELNDRFIFLSTIILGFSNYPEPMRVETLERVRKFYFGDGPIGKDAAFNMIEMATDAQFLYPTTQVIKMHKKYTKAPVFFYEFAHLSQSHRSFIVAFGAPSPDYGVCHCDDLLYLFPMTVIPGELGTDDVHVSRKFIDYLVRFARTGKPTADRAWQEVAHPDAAEYMHIGSPGDIQIRANIAARRMQMWSEVPIEMGRMPSAHDEL